MIEKMFYLTSISLFISFLLSTVSCSYLNNLTKKDSENEPAKQTIEQKTDTDKGNKSDDDKNTNTPKEEDQIDLENKQTENGPTNLPEDVPFYKDSKIEFESSKGATYSLKYIAKASTKTVFSFYEKELNQMGWAIQPSINLDIPGIGKPIAPISAKKEKRNCTITILGNKENECLVHLVVNS